MDHQPRIVPSQPIPPRSNIPVQDSARRGAAVTYSALLCLGLIALLLASTVVLSLIPLYLPKKDTTVGSSVSRRSYSLSPNLDVPAYGALPWSTCNTIVQALGGALRIPPGAIAPSSCVVGTSATTGRRRRSLFFRRLPRAGSSSVFATATLDCTKTNKCSSSGGSSSGVGTGFSTTVTLFGVEISSFLITNVQKNAFASISTANGTVSA